VPRIYVRWIGSQDLTTELFGASDLPLLIIIQGRAKCFDNTHAIEMAHLLRLSSRLNFSRKQAQHELNDI
jgi:hypothetical protein